MTYFSETLEVVHEDFHEVLAPEMLLDKTCGGCVRCEKRNRGKAGYHCCMQNYNIDIHPEDHACAHWWDKEEHERIKRVNQENTEKRRRELWTIYSEKEPISLPIVQDGYGTIPKCPVCGEMPYSTEQCHWCGQHFLQDEEIKKYAEPKIQKGSCPNCGAPIDIHISSYNGHKYFHCDACKMTVME